MLKITNLYHLIIGGKTLCSFKKKLSCIISYILFVDSIVYIMYVYSYMFCYVL